MAPTVTIASHNMATQIEDEPLLWYLVNSVIDPDSGDIFQYKYLIQSNKRKQDTSGTPYCQRNVYDLHTDFHKK